MALLPSASVSTETPLRFVATEGTGEVSGLLSWPDNPTALLLFAHGAGADMHHHFMADATRSLTERGLAVLRYQFPYTEAGRKRPDVKPRLVATVRSAVQEAHKHAKGLPVFAGGKSMGGRMTSHLAATDGEGLSGLFFYGFPLHPAGKPGTDRAEHLPQVSVPMLFLQGTRDKLAEMHLIERIVADLPTARMHVVEDADHSFGVRKTRGHDPAAVIPSMADAVATWVAEVAPRG